MTTQYEKLLLKIGFDRGYSNDTYATCEESRLPGYDSEWLRGRLTKLVKDAIVGARSQDQHERNLGLYSLLEAQRILESNSD